MVGRWGYCRSREPRVGAAFTSFPASLPRFSKQRPRGQSRDSCRTARKFQKSSTCMFRSALVVPSDVCAKPVKSGCTLSLLISWEPSCILVKKQGSQLNKQKNWRDSETSEEWMYLMELQSVSLCFPNLDHVKRWRYLEYLRARIISFAVDSKSWDQDSLLKQNRASRLPRLQHWDFPFFQLSHSWAASDREHR